MQTACFFPTIFFKSLLNFAIALGIGPRGIKLDRRWKHLAKSRHMLAMCGLAVKRGLSPMRVEAMQTRARRAGRKNSLPLPSRLVRMTSQLICACSRAETALWEAKSQQDNGGEQDTGGICNSRRCVFAKQMAGKAGGFLGKHVHFQLPQHIALPALQPPKGIMWLSNLKLRLSGRQAREHPPSPPSAPTMLSFPSKRPIHPLSGRIGLPGDHRRAGYLLR